MEMGNAVAGERQSQVRSKLEQLKRVADVLEEDAKWLIERLEPVLNPGEVPIMGEIDGKKLPETLVPFANELNCLLEKLKYSERQFGQIRNRLEL